MAIETWPQVMGIIGSGRNHSNLREPAICKVVVGLDSRGFLWTFKNGVVLRAHSNSLGKYTFLSC